MKLLRLIFLIAILTIYSSSFSEASKWVSIIHGSPGNYEGQVIYIDADFIVENRDGSKETWVKTVFSNPQCVTAKCINEFLTYEKFLKNRMWTILEIILYHTDGTSISNNQINADLIRITPGTYPDEIWKFLYRSAAAIEK